jgi:hypothetical protein
MARPSACGWPDETNTGVPRGVTLTPHQGDLTVTQAGTVIDRMDLRGCLIIKADNVTVRNSRIGQGGGCEYYVVQSFDRSGILIEDSEIVLTGMNTKGIAFDGYTARRVWFHGGADCAHAGRDVVIEHSFCDIRAGQNLRDYHIDGFQDVDAGNIVIRHNTVRVPYSQTAAILMPDSDNVTIVDNLVAGGGWSIYCPRAHGATVVFTGNRVSRMYYPKGGHWGPADHCPAGTGNVWDDTGEPL